MKAAAGPLFRRPTVASRTTVGSGLFALPPSGEVVEYKIAVDDAAAVHAEIDTAEDARIGLDDRGPSVLVLVIVDSNPGHAVVV